MKTFYIITLLSIALLLNACGKQDDSGTAKSAAPAATSPAPSAPTTSSTSTAQTASSSVATPASDGSTRYIDHAKDEIEFGLKKSLAGLESLLEDVSDADQVAAIKQNIADLKSQLDAL